MKSPTREETIAQASQDPGSLGNVLMKLNFVSREQLDAAIKRQVDVRLGEALVAEGVLTQAQLEVALLHQEMERGTITARTATSRMLKLGNHLTEQVNGKLGNVTSLSHFLTRRLTR